MNFVEAEEDASVTCKDITPESKVGRFRVELLKELS